MQTHGGVSRSFVELYRHLPQEVDAEISILESDNAYVQWLDGIKPSEYQYHHFLWNKDFRGKGYLHRWYDKLTRGGYYPDYNKNHSIKLLQQGDFDIFHPTYFDDYFLPYMNGKPFVLTIHDMIPELYPQYFGSDDFQIVMKRKLAPLANTIITVSEHTKKDVVRILNVSESKVHVVYHGCSFPDKSIIQIPYTKPYVLYVGERWGYKNFSLFVDYVAPVLKKYTDLHVVCTGKPFSSEEIQMMNSLGICDRFIHHWAKTDEEFFSLYHHASCFVYPSEYEGFGIPILEAYKADCPVMLNYASCFPEIAGDAAIYFSMTKESSDFAQQLTRVLSMNHMEREALLSKQRKRLERYSWQKSAMQLYNIYKSIV